jgi:hypothetical protein
MSLEDATEATLPFIGDSVDLTNPMAVLTLVVSLVAGFTMWNMADSWGETLAQRVSTAFGSLAGFNPSTGQSTDNQAPVGGE